MFLFVYKCVYICEYADAGCACNHGRSNCRAENIRLELQNIEGIFVLFVKLFSVRGPTIP